jgi:sigma-B regulation protein RsbU (phosphoserine phosphatase)
VTQEGFFRNSEPRLARAGRGCFSVGLAQTAAGGDDAGMDGPAPQKMQCNEVWGGNAAIDTAVAMAGLDAYVYSRPYKGDAAGGDVHYVSSCATGRIARLLVADVSGHGSQVAEVGAALRRLMRRFMNYVDQSRLVEGLNVEFSKLAQEGRFATAVVATYWVPTDDLILTNAGHPRPLVFRASTGTWDVLEGRSSGPAAGGTPAPQSPGNIPLGIAESSYEHLIAHLDPGDLVLIYTDSLVEARTEGGRLLGEAGLMTALRGLDTAAPERLIPALLAGLERTCPGGFADDVTALLIRPNAHKPRGSVGSTLKAIGLNVKALGALMKGEPFPWPELSHENIGGAMLDRLNRRKPTLPGQRPG